MVDFDSGYQQQTVFDRLWMAARQVLGRVARRQGLPAWGAGFLALALVFHLIGGVFLLQTIFPAALTAGARLAQLGSALLAFGVARHFTLSALPLLTLPPSLVRYPPHALANCLVLLVTAVVVLPLTLYVGFSAHPLVGLLLVLAYGLAGRQLWQQVQSIRHLSHPTARPESAAVVVVERAVTGMPVVQRKAYLAELRAAGVSVRIARALVSAGFSTEAAVMRASDTEILAIRGVGPATLKKIRVCFRGAPD